MHTPKEDSALTTPSQKIALQCLSATIRQKHLHLCDSHDSNPAEGHLHHSPDQQRRPCPLRLSQADVPAFRQMLYNELLMDGMRPERAESDGQDLSEEYVSHVYEVTGSPLLGVECRRVVVWCAGSRFVRHLLGCSYWWDAGSASTMGALLAEELLRLCWCVSGKVSGAVALKRVYHYSSLLQLYPSPSTTSAPPRHHPSDHSPHSTSPSHQPDPHAT